MKVSTLIIVIALILTAVFILLAEREPAVRLAPAEAVLGLGGYAQPDQAEAAASGDLVMQPGHAGREERARNSFTPAPEGVRPHIPILMYHYVRYVDRAVDPLGFGLSVTPEQFAAQLAWLHSNGYETVSMADVARCIRGEGPCPARAVALTFDDGYLDAHTEALPRLLVYGYTATFYIVSDFVGRPGYMGWEELRALRDAGMEIGAHSVNHPDLTRMRLDELRDQVGRSGAVLGAELGQPIVSFCYPLGRYNDTVMAVTREAGYLSATTTRTDLSQHDPFALPRLRISGDTSQARFEQMITAYLP
ncbi:polysaccharide deacetylase family protein [Candidatus Chloroploca sp. M-50]|uniref:Polysaccharide deacetylase family protein n=1 Tax=Candidatus Chloroploca mongolica TaxID=2528176 RepID=A0ABS4D5E9_9CHLR|nr:polysaccharide deacetylase family protein [Candidatus Chloroploca mongolica]MBP1464667.1 polysaccharide deacetylase family protein [Candidatus Chloroploca mongolica]